MVPGTVEVVLVDAVQQQCICSIASELDTYIASHLAIYSYIALS